jgi:2-methylisocitrate lyase-like PEP mutase family enzyme
MAAKTLKPLLQAKQFITAPGVFDGVSAKLADRTDAHALHMTGISTVASYLGLPDAGLATYTQMLASDSGIPGQASSGPSSPSPRSSRP